MINLIKFYFFIFLLKFSLEKELNPIELPVNGTITFEKTKETSSYYFYLNVSDFYAQDKIDIDISLVNKYRDHIYGFEYKLANDINFNNLEEISSNEYNHKWEEKYTYSTFHYHIYLNLRYKYLLGEIYIPRNSVTLTHVRPKKWDKFKIILIIIGVIFLSVFCFILGGMTKIPRIRPYHREQLNEPLHPNINQNVQQEGQQGNILNQQQEPNNLQF